MGKEVLGGLKRLLTCPALKIFLIGSFAEQQRGQRETSIFWRPFKVRARLAVRRGGGNEGDGPQLRQA